MNLLQLAVLDLSNNKLQNFDNLEFLNINNNLEEIYLQNNMIHKISNTLLLQSYKLKKIDLSNNLLFDLHND